MYLFSKAVVKIKKVDSGSIAIVPEVSGQPCLQIAAITIIFRWIIIWDEKEVKVENIVIPYFYV